MLAAEKILDDIDNILEDKATFINQDHSKATYAKKINKKEASIDWNTSAKNILANINGLNGSYFFFKGARYKILKAELTNSSGKAGEIISDNLEIACKELSIKVLMIQRKHAFSRELSNIPNRRKVFCFWRVVRCYVDSNKVFLKV